MPLINALEKFIPGSALDLVAPPAVVSDVTREPPHLSAELDHTPTDHRRAEVACDTRLRALLTGLRAPLSR